MIVGESNWVETPNCVCKTISTDNSALGQVGGSDGEGHGAFWQEQEVKTLKKAEKVEAAQRQ